MERQLHGDLQIIASGGKLYSFLNAMQSAGICENSSAVGTPTGSISMKKHENRCRRWRNDMVSPCKSRPRKRCGIFSIATGFALAFLRDFCWLLDFCFTVRISS